MGQTTTIRVGRSTRDAVNRVRELTGDSTDSVIERALAAYEESLFWQRWREVHADAIQPDDDMAPWDRASAADLVSAENSDTRP